MVIPPTIIFMGSAESSSATQGRARRDAEEGRVFANIISSPDERLREEEAARRRVEFERRQSFQETIRRLKRTNAALARRLEEVVAERSRKEKELAASRERLLEAHRQWNDLRVILARQDVPDEVARVFDTFRITFKAADALHEHETQLRSHQNIVEVYLTMCKSLDVLQGSADVLGEAQAKFPVEDVKRLHEQLDASTNGLRETLKTLTHMRQTATLDRGGVPAAQAAVADLPLAERHRLLDAALGPALLDAPPPLRLPQPTSAASLVVSSGTQYM